MTDRGLEGLKVVAFESRLSKTIGDLIRMQGGEAVLAPSMKEVPLEQNKEAFLFGEKLFAGQIDLLILLTGVGTRTLVQALETKHDKGSILASFRKVPIVPRGPKPIRVLNEFQVPYAITVPEPNTWKELVKVLDDNKDKFPIAGKTVAVQEYGITNKELIDALTERKAHVLRVPVYRWALPDDLEPLKRAIHRIVEGGVDVLVFTTAIQIHHVFQVAESMKAKDAFKKAIERSVVASVGPDTSEGLRSFGIIADIEPESPKMGPLIQKTAKEAKELLGKKRHG